MKLRFLSDQVLNNNRKQYYRALKFPSKGSCDPFILLIAQALERTLDLYLECSGVLGSDEYVPLSVLAKKFPYSQEYLSLLARQGKIDAHKKARNWLATEQSVSEYIRGLG